MTPRTLLAVLLLLAISPAAHAQDNPPAEGEAAPPLELIAPLVLEPEATVVDEREVTPPKPEPPAEAPAGAAAVAPTDVAAEEPGLLLDPDAPPVADDAEKPAEGDDAGVLLLDPDAPPPADESPAPAATPSAPAVWQPEVDFGGEVRSRLGQDLAYEYSLVVPAPGASAERKGTEDVVDWRSSAQFWTRIKLTKQVQTFIELYGEYAVTGKRNEDAPTILFNGSNYRHDWRLQLWEAYFDFFFGPFDLRVGNQIVSWGTMAVMSPSDRINPRDPWAYYWSDISGTREPIVALRGIYHVDDFALEFVWSPFFTDTPLDAYGGDFSLFRYGSVYGNATYPIADLNYYLSGSKTIGTFPELLTTESPGANPLNSQLGARITGNKGGVDFGLSYWFGYEDLPTAYIDNEVRVLGQAILQNNTNLILGTMQSILGRLEDGEPADSFIDSHYRRTHSVAFEFGTTVWELGLKAEAAFTADKTYYTEGLYPVQHHTVSWAAGIDVMKTDLGKLSTLYLDFELFGSSLFGVDAGEQLYFTTENNLGLFTTLRFAFLDDDLQLELVNQTNFSTKDYVIIPKISYSPVQDLSLTVGVMILDAWVQEPAGFDVYTSNPDRKDTLFGSFSNNDQAFFMLKYRY